MGNAALEIESELREIGSRIAQEVGLKAARQGNHKAAGSGPDRRRHERFALGLPVGVQLAGRPSPITVELLDLSATGGRFRCVGEKVRLAETATVAFVSHDQRRCRAEGSVVRTDASGEFALRLDETNDAFAAFLGQLAG
jgi:PilZ domain